MSWARRSGRRDLRGGWAAVAAMQGRHKRISAMMRVRNEEEFLGAAVRSIAPHVDEVLLIDNLSTDSTPRVIASLVRELPHARTVAYPFVVARVGVENLDAVNRTRGRSPHLLSNYYNWGLRQCRHPFILKWDGDMVATDELAVALESWHAGPFLSMSARGANVHPDRIHLLGARCSDAATLGRAVAGRMVPDWLQEMTYTAVHVQLFPRFLAGFDDGLWWCERMRSPFTTRPVASRHQLDVLAPLFLHLKFCKRDPHANHSPEFAAMIQTNVTVGAPLPEAWRRTMSDSC